MWPWKCGWGGGVFAPTQTLQTWQILEERDSHLGLIPQEDRREGDIALEVWTGRQRCASMLEHSRPGRSLGKGTLTSDLSFRKKDERGISPWKSGQGSGGVQACSNIPDLADLWGKGLSPWTRLSGRQTRGGYGLGSLGGAAGVSAPAHTLQTWQILVWVVDGEAYTVHNPTLHIMNFEKLFRNLATESDILIFSQLKDCNLVSGLKFNVFHK